MKGFQESDHKEYHKNACPGCLGKMRKGPRVIMREANFETSDRGTCTERIIIIGRAFFLLLKDWEKRLLFQPFREI